MSLGDAFQRHRINSGIAAIVIKCKPHRIIAALRTDTADNSFRTTGITTYLKNGGSVLKNPPSEEPLEGCAA